MAGRLIRRLASLALAAMAVTAHAAAPSSKGQALAVPQIQVWTRNTIRYACDHGQALTVHYINAKNEQSFALLNVQGRSMLLVNVIAASGAKYVGRQYSWWTKGPEGDLRDDTADSNTAPILSNCKARR